MKAAAMEDFKVPTLPAAGPNRPETISEDAEKVAPDTSEPQDHMPNRPVASCPYKAPKWSMTPPSAPPYKFEILKSGQIIEEVSDLQTQPIWKFGRLPENDIGMAHPTISRFHAVLQYHPGDKADVDEEDNNAESEKAAPVEGWYIYDLNSTHGTFLNKQRLPARTYIRLRVGHMLRLGGSSRSYILQGPTEDAEPESEFTVTELRAQRQQQVEEAAAAERTVKEQAVELERKEGISWGMTEDADEETDLTHNPYASTNNEELFLDDPKRTLRGYFEREGLPLEYKCDELSTGSFVCRIELPVDDTNGRPIVAEVVHKGRKKECAAQCALEACRILDRHGVLRQANQEPQKRKVKSKDSDSDDDSFWDRTGDIERRKQRKANANVSVTLTYDDLLQQERDVLRQMDVVDADIASFQELQRKLKANKAAQEADGGEDLDSFMEHLSEDAPQTDRTEIRKLRLEQQRLKAERQRLQRLIKLAKPVCMQFGKSGLSTTNEAGDKASSAKKQLPMIGKRNQFSKFKVLKPVTPTSTSKEVCKELASDEEEVDEEEVVSKSVAQKADKEASKADNKVPAEEISSQPKRHYGPTLLPKDVPQDITENSTLSSTDEKPAKTTALKEAEELDKKLSVDDQEKETDQLSPPARLKRQTSEEQNEQAINNKKRRQRHRQRGKRQDIDIDELDEHETSEKYAKWVPPENQSGDGFTKLNEKFGY